MTVGTFICTLILTRIYKKEIVKVSQDEEMQSKNLNNGFMTQTNINQQSIDNNQVQNQNLLATQSITSIENNQLNIINNEATNSNNQTESNRQ